MLSACQNRPDKIPPDTMAEVYADMFLADQWVFDHELKYLTDTVAVYEPIFEKYGYDVDDFRYSVDQYMNDAEKFADVLEQTKFLLQCKLKEVDEKRLVANKLDSIRLARQMNAIDISLMELKNEERDTLLKKFFPMFPVDSIGVMQKKILFKGPALIEEKMEPAQEADTIAIAPSGNDSVLKLPDTGKVKWNKR